MSKAPAKAPAPRPVLYLKSGGPPADWRDYDIIRVSSGKKMKDLIEANAYEGWVVQVRRDAAGNIQTDAGGRPRTLRLSVKIRIVRRPPASAAPKEPKT